MRPLTLYALMNLLERYQENPAEYSKYINILAIKQDMIQMINRADEQAEDQMAGAIGGAVPRGRF